MKVMIEIGVVLDTKELSKFKKKNFFLEFIHKNVKMKDIKALRDSFSPLKILIYLETKNEQVTNLQNFPLRLSLFQLQITNKSAISTSFKSSKNSKES
jgi:hypothetical protein